MRTTTLLLLIATALVACGTTTQRPLTAEWSAPERYEFVVESSCGERGFLGRYHVVVEDGEVSDATGHDDPAQRLLADEERRNQVPTLSELLNEAQDARAEGADVVEVTFDESDGHPSAIEIDWDANAIDDEACYAISDYNTDPT